MYHDGVNATTNNSKSTLHDPFHSYFEYHYENAQAKDLIHSRGIGHYVWTEQ